MAYAHLTELLRTADLSGQIVMFRADLNIPMQAGRAQDTMRLKSHKKSLHALSESGARIVIMSHFGRPQGQRHPDMSLAPAASALSDILQKKIAFAPDCIGEEARSMIANMKNGNILVLENTRFHKGEEDNHPDFAAQLAEPGNFYVNDAFSVAHRANASTEAIAHILPAFAGFALDQEVKALEQTLSHPQHPALGIAGGAKILSKINILLHLLDRMDVLIIGGAMANALLAAKGLMPRSAAHVNDEDNNAASLWIEKAAASSCRIILPQDVIIANNLKDRASARPCDVQQVPDQMFCLDIGPKTVAAIAREIDQAATILWNGPLGAYETQPFHQGTKDIAAHIAALTKSGKIISVAGGGETAAAINLAGCSSDFTHISTAGGAFLTWLEGSTLPAIAALTFQGKLSPHNIKKASHA